MQFDLGITTNSLQSYQFGGPKGGIISWNFAATSTDDRVKIVIKTQQQWMLAVYINDFEATKYTWLMEHSMKTLTRNTHKGILSSH